MGAKKVERSPVERAILARERVIKSMKTKIANIEEDAKSEIAAIRSKLNMHETILSALRKGA